MMPGLRSENREGAAIAEQGAPFSERFEKAVGLACESAAVRRVARQPGRESAKTGLAADGYR